MENVKVTYFNIKGLGEGIRLLLAYGGQEFEDVRIKHEDWPELKATTPFGQLPLMEVDGKVYAQNQAICRYLGHKYGLAGATLEEDLLIDQNIDFYNDIRMKATFAFRETDEKIKAEKLAELLSKEYPVLLPKLDKILKENNGFMAAGKLTWADFVFAGMYGALKLILQIPDLDEKYPSFKKLKDTVYSLPRVKEFSDAAPQTDY